MPRTPVPESRFEHFVRRKKAGAKAFVTEGDSWFAYPLWLSTNVIEELIQRFPVNTTWMQRQSNGDEAREMMCGPQYTTLVALFERLQAVGAEVDGILFSGGGNDIVGKSLLPLLNKYRDGMTWMDCIQHNRFERRLGAIADAYRELADLRADYQPKAVVFTHAYDYAIVSGKPICVLGIKIGPWIKNYMEDVKGITRLEFQQEIINHMLSRLDDVQTRLEQEYRGTGWVYVRTQGALANSDWANELHPTKAGFRKVSDKFAAAIEANIPGVK
jgi:hypothetical protein